MILTCLLVLTLGVFAPESRAQDAATQAQLDKLSGQIQDISEALAVQNKHIDDLEQKLNDLQGQLNQPGANNFASEDDLKKLADQVQQIDQKRQSDNDQILKELEQMEKGLSITPEHHVSESSPSSVSTPSPSPVASAPHYEYEIKAGDTIGAIARAYTAQGIKVTTKEILEANPGLNPSALKIGQKIIIPQPQ